MLVDTSSEDLFTMKYTMVTMEIILKSTNRNNEDISKGQGIKTRRNHSIPLTRMPPKHLQSYQPSLFFFVLMQIGQTESIFKTIKQSSSKRLASKEKEIKIYQDTKKIIASSLTLFCFVCHLCVGIQR